MYSRTHHLFAAALSILLLSLFTGFSSPELQHETKPTNKPTVKTHTTVDFLDLKGLPPINTTAPNDNLKRMPTTIDWRKDEGPKKEAGFDFFKLVNEPQPIPDSLLHKLRLIGSVNGCIEFDSTDHTKTSDLFDSGIGNKACEIVNLIPSVYNFRIHDYTMFPNLIWTNLRRGHDEAYNSMLDDVKATSTYYFLIGIQVNPKPGGNPIFRASVKLPPISDSTNINLTLEELIAVEVQSAMESGYAETSYGISSISNAELKGLEKFKEIIEGLQNNTFKSELSEEVLKKLGFREMKHENVPVFENTNGQDISDPFVKDYSGIKIDNISVSKFVSEASIGFFGNYELNSLAVITANKNYYTGDFSTASSKFSNINNELSVWVHCFESNNGNKIFIKYRANIDKEKADQIIDNAYNDYKNGKPVTRSGKNIAYRSCPNLDFLSDEPWSARASLMPCIENYGFPPLFGGLLCGIIDGLVEPLGYLARAGGFLKEVYANTPLISLSWWTNLYENCIEAESISQGILNTFEDNYIFWSGLVDDLTTFVSNAWLMLEGLVNQIIEFFEEPPEFDINAIQMPEPKTLGYNTGSLLVGYALDALVGGVGKFITSALDSAGVAILKNSIRQGAGGIRGFVQARVTEFQKLTCKLQGLGCFTAGTLVHTPTGSTPIEDIDLGSLVITNEHVNDREILIDESSGSYAFEGVQKKDYLTSDNQRVLDLHGYDGNDMLVVKFKIIDNNSNPVLVELLRPKFWLKEKNITTVGQQSWISIPEIGIQGNAIISEIAPLKTISHDQFSSTLKKGYISAPVTGTISRYSSEILDLSFEDNESIEITSSHPIYSISRHRWALASELLPGETVLSSIKSECTVKSIEKIKGQFQVYNLEVGYTHNFLVGKNGILVHNKCPDAWNKLVNTDPRLKDLISRLRIPGLTKALTGPKFDKIKQVLNLSSDIVVCMDDFGFPDFLPFVKKVNGVECIFPIDMNGDQNDRIQANEKLRELLIQQGVTDLPQNVVFDQINGYFSTPDRDDIKYTWHHHQDGTHMMLVPYDINSGVNHTGGAKLSKLKNDHKLGNILKLPNPWTTSTLWKTACQ